MQSNNEMSGVMCRSKRDFQTSAFEKHVSHHDKQILTSEYVAGPMLKSRYVQNELETERSGIHSLNRNAVGNDETSYVGQVLEISHAETGSSLLTRNINSVRSMELHWPCVDYRISSLKTEAKQDQVPQPLTKSYNSSAVVDAGKFLSDRKRANADGDIALSDMKRRKLGNWRHRDNLDANSGDELQLSSSNGHVNPKAVTSRELNDLLTRSMSKKSASGIAYGNPRLFTNIINHDGDLFVKKKKVTQTSKKQQQKPHKKVIYGICLFINPCITSKFPMFSCPVPRAHIQVFKALGISKLECIKINSMATSYIANGKYHLFTRLLRLLKMDRNIIHCTRSLKPFQGNLEVRTYTDNGKVTSQINGSDLLSECLRKWETARSVILVIDKRLRAYLMSRNVSKKLRHLQVDVVLGRSIERFIHPSELQEMTRFIRCGQFKIDKENSLPWTRRRQFSRAMKHFSRKHEGRERENGYKKTICNASVHRKKKAQDAKVEGTVFLSDTLLAFRKNGYMPIRSRDTNLRFLICDTSCEEAKQKSSEEKEVFDNIKFFGFRLEKDLRFMNLMESSRLLLLHQRSWDITRNLLLERHLVSHPAIFHGHTISKLKKQIHLSRISNINSENNHMKPLTDNIQQLPENCYCELLISPNLEGSFSSSDNLALNFSSASACHEASDSKLNLINDIQNKEMKPKSLVTLYGMNDTTCLTVDHGQQHSSQLVQATSCCWDHIFDLRYPHELKDVSQHQPMIPLDEMTFDELCLSDNPKMTLKRAINLECHVPDSADELETSSEEQPHDVKITESKNAFIVQNSNVNNAVSINAQASLTLNSDTDVCRRKSPSVKVTVPSSSILTHHVTALLSPIFNLPPKTDHISSTLSLESTSDLDHQAKGDHSQNNIQTDSKSVTSLTESNLLKADYHSQVHQDVSSKMTNRKSDPFLSQASITELNSQPDAYALDEFTSEVFPIMSSLLSFPTGQSKLSYINMTKMDKFPSSSCQSFMDLSSSLIDSSFSPGSISDLDSFLNTIPISLCSTMPVSNTVNTQSIPVAPKLISELGIETQEPAVSVSVASPGSLSHDSSDSETSSKPSLLRTLLDKEGAAMRRPQTYTKCVFSRKSCDMKRTNNNKYITNSRFPGGRRTRDSKNPLRKTTELPLLRSAFGYMMKFGRNIYHPQKPTKELPLPSSARTAESRKSSLNSTHSIFTSGARQDGAETEAESNSDLNSSETGADLNLPEDLLDMALEYCTPLGTDHPEAILSNLSESDSWEDNLYSLIESSAQDTSINSPRNQNTQHQSEQSVSSTWKVLDSKLPSNSHQPKQICSVQSLSCFPTEECILEETTNSESTEEHMEVQQSLCKAPIIETPLSEHQLHQTNVRSQCNPTFPLICPSNPMNQKGKMSLLRAAVTSPDVDKLIEEIPLRNSKKHIRISHVKSSHSGSDPDIIIRLPNNPVPLSDRVVQVPFPNYERTQGKISAFQSEHNHTKCLTASIHSDTEAAFKHVHTTSLLEGQFGTRQLVETSSSCTVSSKTPKTPSSMDSPVIQISLNQTSSPKVININKGVNNNSSKKLKHNSLQMSHNALTSHAFPKGASIADTEPPPVQSVSVVVMRRESHRSRKSKSIAVQTDNKPDEVYPEFEHSSSDIILYPSVIITNSNSSAVSPPCHMSERSSSVMPPSSMSELEKVLLGHSSDESSTTSSSSADDDSQITTTTPFLLKLLTGELSRDHYQILDRQLLERERRKSILLESEVEL